MNIIDYKNLIEGNPIAFSSVNLDWTPNVISVAFVKVIWDNQIIVSDNYMKQTKENILNNNNVCLAVWDEKWNWIKIIWKASYYTVGIWYDYIKKIKENERLPAKWAIVINIEKIIKLY